MKLISNLLHRTHKSADRNRKIRGLSTAELVGIIVIVGILGALGGTYVNGLVTQANANGGKQNATTLNTVVSSILAAGGDTTQGATSDNTKGQIDTTSAATVIAACNNGVTVGTVLYKMIPPIAATSVASYTATGTAVPTTNVIFTYAGPTP